MFKPKTFRRFHGARVGPDALVRTAEQSSAGSFEDPAFKSHRPINTIALLALTWLCSIPLLRGQSPDLPPGPAQAKVRTACLECHDASIIVQQRLSKAAWGKEV